MAKMVASSPKQRSNGFIYRVVSDSVIATAAAVAAADANKRAVATNVTKCECCGLGEECTAGYVKRVQQQFCGHFVCGLCAEAVKEEQARIKGGGGGKAVEDAIQVHMNICKQFNVTVRENPVAAATSAMRQLLVRRARSGLQLSRSTSCIPALAATTKASKAGHPGEYSWLPSSP
ncbi:uncharacterized protein LOC9645713 [Selaginella moellendorffii]|nr:uncharacterized protein LOC9645713 [Selaginella moellendorffii]|eukprot:XP_024530560.1 uncharacterized protein LOC9645713 [Selaginella moellendorffii]